jgi:hypothetical protein
MGVTRRNFVAFVASAIPVALVTRRAEALGAAWVAGEPEMLRAVAEVVLPSELGAAGAARVASDFIRWMDEYKEGVEIVHGYGTSALRYTRGSPRANWAAQLEALSTRTSREPRAESQKPFLQASVEARRAILREELKNERTDRMPAVGSASHVALGLLAFYYGTSDASDLCYTSKIGRQKCRPLAENSRKPLPIAGGAR